MPIIRKCLTCEVEFRTKPSRIKIGCGKFCSQKCYIKTGIKNPNWKGGKRVHDEGYILIYKPKHPSAINGRYVFEHRFVMEKHLERYLKPKEVVHHINGIKTDNRIKNLKIMSHSRHFILHNSGRYKKGNTTKVRQCYKCKIIKNINMFHKSKDKPLNHVYICKSCKNHVYSTKRHSEVWPDAHTK